MPTNTRNWLDTGLWLLLITGGIIAIWLQCHYNKYVEIDSLSYINIGELYAAGLFQKAINGYWSPLYSWIIALFIKSGVRPHITCYCMNVLAAFACFYFLQKLGRRYLQKPVLYVLFQLFAIVLLLYYALSELTPDLTGTAATLWFLTILWSDGFNKSYRLPVWAGIAGAVMFFAKSYNFVFLNLLFFVLIIAEMWFSNPRKEQRYRAPVLALLVFWCSSLVWIVPLSLHEGKPTFSTAGGYSHNLSGPGHPEHPIIREVIPPPFEEAYTAWFDPAKQLDDRPWPVFGSMQNTIYQLRRIRINTGVMIIILNRWHIRIDIVLICAVLLALCDKRRLGTWFRQMKPWLLVLLLYPIGYLPFFVEGRYIYIEALLILLLFFCVVQETGYCFSVTARRAFIFNILVVMIVGSYLCAQLFAFVQEKTNMYKYSRSLHEWQNRLPFLGGERIVSDKNNYLLATQLCYRLHARLYGVWNPGEQDEISKYQVKYLLSGTQRPEPFLELREVIPAEKGSIYVYAFAKPADGR